MPRRPRYIPEGATEVTRPGLKAVAYVKELVKNPGDIGYVPQVWGGDWSDNPPEAQPYTLFCAIGYRANAANPDFSYSFKTAAAWQDYIDKWFDGLLAHAAAIKARSAQRKEFRHTLKLGDILYSTWGYVQTNLDYYQVIELRGRSLVKVRKLQQETVTSDPVQWTGSYLPLKDHFTDDPADTYRVQEGNNVKLTSYSVAGPWDGKAKYAGGGH